MSVRHALVAAATVLCLVLAESASAEYYFTRQGAEKMARDYVSKKYGYDYSAVYTSCRPQGQRRDDPNYKYHRWVCGWVTDEDTCGGQVRIVGSRGRGAYYGLVIRGISCY